MNGELPKSSSLRGGVILIHGVLNPRYALWLMQKRFRKAGFEVLNCHYQSWGKSIDQIFEKIGPECQRFHEQLPDSKPLYIVGHSLGAILCRKLALELNLTKLNRIVLLAPPNQGSHVASRLAKPFHKLVPTLTELSDTPDSYVNHLPQSLPVECGIITADPDYVIESRCSHLESETDYTVERGPHSAIIFRKSVFEQSLYFMENGRFQR